MNGETRRRSLFFPILLVGLGVFLILINIGVIPGTIRENLRIYWPVILILGGLDGLWRREGLVWQLVLLGLGVILLLGNLGYLATRALPLLSKVWPILLVAVGIDIAFGKNRHGWYTVLHAGLGILMMVLIFWLAVAFPTVTNTRDVFFEQSVDGATSSNIDISMLAGEFKLTGDSKSDKLLAVSAVLPGNVTLTPDYTSPKNGESSLVIKVDNDQWQALNTTSYSYNFKVFSGLPIKLDTQLIMGDFQINLLDTEVNELNTEMAVGAQTVYLPCNDGLTANLQQAVGNIELYIPQGCKVTIRLENALVNTNLPGGYLRNGDVVTNPAANESSGSLEVKIGLAVGVVGIHETK